jgi:hypothetical protein
MSVTRICAVVAVFHLSAVATVASAAVQAAAPDPSAASAGSGTTAPVPQDAPPPSMVTPGEPGTTPDQIRALRDGENRLVTNGPVPDTPANRARFGKPLSHAGKKTAPTGN